MLLAVVAIPNYIMEITGIRMVLFGAVMLLSHAAFFPFEAIPTPGTVPVAWRGLRPHPPLIDAWEAMLSLLRLPRSPSSPSTFGPTWVAFHVSPASF
jgi:hypothetical protein